MFQDNSLIVKEVSSDFDDMWIKFVSENPHSTIYHHPTWLKVLEKETKQKVLRLVCFDKRNNIVGVFPLQYTKGMPLGIGGILSSRRLSSLPRTPVGAPLTTGNKSTTLLLQKAIEIVSINNDCTLQIKSFNPDLNENIDDLNRYFWREVYIKELPEYPKEIRFGKSKNHVKIKWAVNKAEQNNVSYKIAETEEDLQNWYRLYLDTMRFHVTPARTFHFFKDLWEELKPQRIMQLVLAVLETDSKNIVIAGSVLFYYNKVVTHAFSGSSRIREHIDLRPNDFLHFYAMLDAQMRGYKYYDFGEVSKDNLGLAAYKKKWGPAKTKMFHYYYPKPNKLKDDDVDIEKIGGLRKKIWKALPLNLSEKLGQFIYNKL